MTRDCNTCAKHIQGAHPGDRVVFARGPIGGALTCADCLNEDGDHQWVQPLPLWEPKDMNEKTAADNFVTEASLEPIRERLAQALTRTNDGAARANAGKPPLSLVVRELVEGTARGLAYGRDKYTKLTGSDATHNWKKGFPWLSLVDSLERHLHAWKDGEDTDAESGLSHLDLVACNLMFIMWHIKHRPDLDNRWKGGAV